MTIPLDQQTAAVDGGTESVSRATPCIICGGVDGSAEREVSWHAPCHVCGGTEGCTFEPPHTARCATLDNGLGRYVIAESGRDDASPCFKYDLRMFRHVAGAAAAVALLRQRFFNRTDVVCHLARWGKPCPAHGGDDIDALLRAHCFGRARHTRIRWFSKEHPDGGEESGCFKIGTYAPAPDGSTKWLCIDFDGQGDHSAPLADPLAVALSVQALCYRIGVHAHLERSGSATGWHVWVFFDSPVPAKKARQLGCAIVPYDADLTDGNLADPKSGKGIEVFPKRDTISADGRGNQVWCPFFWRSKPGGGLFYRFSPRGFEPYVPLDFDTVDEARLDVALRRLNEEVPA